jgi:hypothetical protein
MKKSFLVSIFILVGSSLFAQNEKAFFDHLINQDFDRAAAYFEPELNLCVLDFEDVVTKTEAVGKLRTFFAQNPPASYAIKHTGQSKGGQSNYYVVDLVTRQETYRLFAYFDKMGNQRKISELRIETL